MKFTTTLISLAALTLPLTTASPITSLTERSGSKLSQSAAASRLTSAGITSYSSGGCTDRTKPTCTSYEQVNSGTVDGAITLKNACRCALQISGGTEVGHASGTYSHYNGYKFDFRKNPTLDSYVKNTFTRIANRGDGYPQWKSAAGNIYCDEGNHWDVTYY